MRWTDWMVFTSLAVGTLIFIKEARAVLLAGCRIPDHYHMNCRLSLGNYIKPLLQLACSAQGVLHNDAMWLFTELELTESPAARSGMNPAGLGKQTASMSCTAYDGSTMASWTTFKVMLSSKWEKNPSCFSTEDTFSPILKRIISKLIPYSYYISVNK